MLFVDILLYELTLRLTNLKFFFLQSDLSPEIWSTTRESSVLGKINLCSSFLLLLLEVYIR